MKRIVVTGTGTITSIGHTSEEFWNNLLSGKSGIVAINEQWASDNPDLKCKVYSPVTNFNPVHLGPKEIKRSDISTRFGIEAAYAAVQDAGLDMTLVDAKEFRYTLNNVDSDRIGALIGSGLGGSSTELLNHAFYVKGNYRDVSLLTVPLSMVNADSALIAKKFGLHGPNYIVSSACASATDAIGVAYEKILLGKADIMITGGVESIMRDNGFIFSCFDKMTAMARKYNDNPAAASRPFDKGRDGFVMGEGAGILVFEELEHAKARGARILAEIVGYESTCDAYDLTAPEPSGQQIIRLLKDVVLRANLKLEDIGYINAHGTSTDLNDKTETKAIRDAFGIHADKLLVSSTKSMVGHLMGASGGVEAIATVMTLYSGKVHPTINQEHPDPDCNLNYVPNTFVEAPIRYALSNSFGFGGHNASLLFKKYEG